jgi:hypothetical protein
MTVKVKPWKPNCATLYEGSISDEIAYNAACEGGNVAAIAAALGVGKRTVELWMTQHPSFIEAVDAGKCVGEARLDKLADDHMVLIQEPNGPKTTFDTSMYKFKKKITYKARENDATTIITDKETIESPEKMKALQELVNNLHKGDL